MPYIGYGNYAPRLAHGQPMSARRPISLLRSLRRVSLDGYFPGQRQGITTYEANMTIDCENTFV